MASVVTVLMVAGMILAVMLTTGRTVGAEQQVLESVDSAGTRSIIARADTAAGIRSDVLDRTARIEGIQWAGAFSSAVDATNAQVLDGTRVPVRCLYTENLGPLGVPAESAVPGDLAWASRMALDQLAFPREQAESRSPTGHNTVSPVPLRCRTSCSVSSQRCSSRNRRRRGPSP